MTSRDCPHCETPLGGAPAWSVGEGPFLALVICPGCSGLLVDETGGRAGEKPCVRPSTEADLAQLHPDDVRHVVGTVLDMREQLRQREGHVDPRRFLVNLYGCPKCERAVVTVDVAVGTTPFMVSCRHLHPEDPVVGGCDGTATSSLYRTEELNADDMMIVVPEMEWYLPMVDEIIEPRYANHVARGGLLLRPRTNAPPMPRTPRETLN